MCVHVHQCYGGHVEIRGQLVGVTSPASMWALGIKLGLSGPTASTFYPLSPLSSLLLLF